MEFGKALKDERRELYTGHSPSVCLTPDIVTVFQQSSYLISHLMLPYTARSHGWSPGSIRRSCPTVSTSRPTSLGLIR